jgi:transglutaminase-like putative cysteine protease
VPARRNGSLVALGALSGVAALGFARLFGDSTWVLPALVAVLGAHGLGALTRRWPAVLALVASVVGMALLLCWVVAGHTTFFGLPTQATLTALGGAWEDGIDGFRNAVAPTPVTSGLLLLAVGGTWLCATAADWLAFRAEATLTAIVPPFVLYVVSAALGTAGLKGPVTFAFVVTALIFVATHHAAALPTAWFAGRTPPPGLVRMALGGAPVAVVVAVAGLVLGPSLPGARADALLDLRGSGGNGDESRITVSPLVDLKPRLTANPPAELFTVRAPVPIYWRLTSLDTFDGRIWSSRGTYRPASGRLPEQRQDKALVYKVRQDFAISRLDSFWLPAAYRPTHIDLSGARVNAESLTLLTEAESAAGLSYQVESAIPRYGPADLAQAPAGIPPELAAYGQLPPDFPEDVRDLARNVTAEAAGPYEKALALQDYLRNNYKYDETAPAGHSDDHLRYFLFRSRIGYCEQFAGAFGAMARAIGLPTRVAVGFTPGQYDQTLDAWRVTTREAHAWPEVHVNGQGWVAFEPTPGRYEPNPTNYTGTYNPDANPITRETTTSTAAGGNEPTASTSRPKTSGREDAGDDAATPSLSEKVAGWVPAVALAVALVGALLSVPPLLKRRRRHRRRGAGSARARVTGAWSEAIDRLRETGTTPTAAATPIEFARGSAVGAEAGTSLRSLAGLFTKALYSDAGPSDDEASQAWEAVEHLSRALDTGDSRLGRWRRRLNPVPLMLREPTPA